MVLLHNPGFANGLGMDIHVRAKVRDTWSYIETGKTVVLAFLSASCFTGRTKILTTTVLSNFYV